MICFLIRSWLSTPRCFTTLWANKTRILTIFFNLNVKCVISSHLSDRFHIKTELKRGETETPILNTFVLHAFFPSCKRSCISKLWIYAFFLPTSSRFCCVNVQQVCFSRLSVMVKLVDHALRTLGYERGKERFEEHPGSPHERDPVRRH